ELPPSWASNLTGADDSDSALALDLSDRIRRGDLDAYIEIPAGLMEGSAVGAKGSAVEYHSNNPNDDILRDWLTTVINNEVRARRFRAAGLDQALSDRLSQPIQFENLELVERDEASGVKSAEKVDPIRTAAVPAVLL